MPTFFGSIRTTISYSAASIGSIVLASCASVPGADNLPQTESEQGIEVALERYSQAWAARDVDAILARHAEDTEFHLVTLGSSPAETREELRTAFSAIFASNPNYRSTVRRVRISDDFAVVEYDIHMDPDRPARAGATVFTPLGEPNSAPAVDIIVFDDGLVTQKITYLDTETIRANSASVERASE